MFIGSKVIKNFMLKFNFTHTPKRGRTEILPFSFWVRAIGWNVLFFYLISVVLSYIIIYFFLINNNYHKRLGVPPAKLINIIINTFIIILITGTFLLGFCWLLWYNVFFFCIFWIYVSCIIFLLFICSSLSSKFFNVFL